MRYRTGDQFKQISLESASPGEDTEGPVDIDLREWMLVPHLVRGEKTNGPDR
jgi:hypothetical protein